MKSGDLIAKYGSLTLMEMKREMLGEKIHVEPGTEFWKYQVETLRKNMIKGIK